MIKESKSKSKSKSSIVEDSEVRSHWLDGSGNRDGNGNGGGR